MRNLIVTGCVWMFAGLMCINAQDDKNKNANKNDKTVLEEHKNGGKKDESNTAVKKPENNSERKTENQQKHPEIKKTVHESDVKPH